MIRGTQKKIVVLKNTDSKLFEEAYFILKSDAEAKGTHTFNDMLSEANRILAECDPCREKKPKLKQNYRFILYMSGVMSGIILSIIIMKLCGM